MPGPALRNGSATGYRETVIWLRLGLGVVFALVGLVWLGQGLNLIKGSFMTGQPQWATIGAVLVVVAAWPIWGAVRAKGWFRS